MSLIIGMCLSPYPAHGRVRSRLFVPVRCPLSGCFVLIFQGTNVCVRSRLVATSRDCSHLIDVGYVASNRVRRDEVSFACIGIDLVAIELGKSTIFLDGADSAGMAGLGIKLGRLLDGKGILVVRRTVATIRVRSRLFAAHGVMIPRRGCAPDRLSPTRDDETGCGRGGRRKSCFPLFRPAPIYCVVARHSNVGNSGYNRVADFRDTSEVVGQCGG
jgi:hypothetical protein